MAEPQTVTNHMTLDGKQISHSVIICNTMEPTGRFCTNAAGPFPVEVAGRYRSAGANNCVVALLVKGLSTPSGGLASV